MVLLTTEQQADLIRDHPQVFTPENGAWALKGATRVDLAAVDDETLGLALTLAKQRKVGAAGLVHNEPPMKNPILRFGVAAAVGLVAFSAAGSLLAQQAAGQQQPPPPPPTLGLEEGVLELDTPDFRLKLVKASQTIAALEPKGVATYTPTPTPPRGRGRGGSRSGSQCSGPTPPPPPQPLNFDFTPADRLPQRAADGFHHLGDITMRIRTGTAGDWKDYDTATTRKPVTTLPASGTTLAAADLSATLPADIPVKVTRAWKVVNGKLALTFEVKNPGTTPVQIGALGIPVVFNNIITGRNLEQAHEICSFFDPAIAGDAGFVQVSALRKRPGARSRATRQDTARRLAHGERPDAAHADVRRHLRMDAAHPGLRGKRMDKRAAVECADDGNAAAGRVARMGCSS